MKISHVNSLQNSKSTSFKANIRIGQPIAVNKMVNNTKYQFNLLKLTPENIKKAFSNMKDSEEREKLFDIFNETNRTVQDYYPQTFLEIGFYKVKDSLIISCFNYDKEHVVSTHLTFQDLQNNIQKKDSLSLKLSQVIEELFTQMGIKRF